MLQDSLYLSDFALALRLLADAPEASPADAATLRGMADGCRFAEQALHQDFVSGWDIPEAAKTPQPRPTTVLYCSYLLRVVSVGSHAEGLAALLPCFWVYHHVGRLMLAAREKSTASRPPQFDAWIDMYAGEAFAGAVAAYKALVEAAAEAATAEVRGKMATHFKRGCDLEYMFWDAALNLQEWPTF